MSPNFNGIDFNNRDNKYWFFIKKLVFTNTKTQSEAEAIWTQIRRIKFNSQNLKKNWDDILPDSIIKWANDYFSSRTDLYCDNFRVALINSPSQCRRYRKQMRRGCCGFSDIVLIGPDGNRYALGYNYGH